MKLILVRHGETIENQQKIVQGINLGTLSENGINQIFKVSKRLNKEENIDLIITSDLNRTYETAKIISKKKKILIIKDKLLREIDFLDWEGKFIPNLDLTSPPKKMESNEELLERMKEFFEKIKKYKGKTILIISHYANLSAILCYIMDTPIKNLYKFKQDNTAVSIILKDKRNNWNIKLLNCKKHLIKND